jgi:lipopolysaccharide biosynthesis regulator YciM
MPRLPQPEPPGQYNGQHFTTYVTHVQDLQRAGKLNEAEQLLLHLVDATEADSQAHACGVAPWYYEQLAIIYRKQKDHQREIAILERFQRQTHSPGVKPAQLTQRLAKARQLATKPPVHA